jgi:outer membrane receptor protein involved in Fe transport
VKLNITFKNPLSASSLLGVTAAGLLAFATAYAEDDESKRGSEFFEEVVVTAERVEANILDTAMTITAFDSDMLQQLGLQDRDKLQNLVPGLQFGDTMDQQGNGVVLRGIGTRQAGMNHMDRAVAQYVNGAYTIGTYGTLPGGGFDLEGIEIARGPQGTLNGRNSLAGSINYLYKKPTRELDAVIEVEVTDVTQERVNVAFGGPVPFNENLAFRITAGSHTGDGIQENDGIGGDYGAPDHLFGAGQLRFQTDRIDANVRYSYVQDQGVPSSLVSLMNPNVEDAEISILGAYTIGNPPPQGVQPIVNLNYLRADGVSAIAADCPIGMPGQRCGDVENRVFYNYQNREDSRAKRWDAYISFDVSESVNVKYTYSDGDTSQMYIKEYDYSNQQPSAEDDTLSLDGGVAYRNQFGELPYDYDETSHELLITYSPSDKLTVQGGAFQYANGTRWAVIRNELNNWWRDGTADEQWSTYDGPDTHAWGVVTGMNSFANCQEGLEAFNDAYSWFRTSAEQAAAEGGTTWYTCPEGDYHTQNVYYGTRAKQKSQAVFANVDYTLNESWAISAGLRYVEDEKLQSLAGQQGFFCTGFLQAGPACSGYDNGGFDYPNTWDAVVGQTTVEYTLPNENLLYGRISTGHQAGVFNREENGQVFAQDWSNESNLVNFEVGSKGFVMDGRLQYALGAYLMQYDDMQIEAFQPAPDGASMPITSETPIVEYAGNIGKTDVWGVEFEYAFALNDRTRIMGFYAYQDSELGQHESVVSGDPDAQWDYHEHLDEQTGMMRTSPYQLPADQTGNQLPNQPKHKAAATLSYDYPLSNGSSVTFYGTYSYIAEAYPTIANVELYKMPSFSRLDLSASWFSGDESLNVQLFVNNVFDEIGINEFMMDGNLGGNLALAQLTQHRFMGLRVRYTPNF